MTIEIYDLHSHTTASDGLLPPVALVAAAQQAGVTTLAITDHDTVAAIKEAQLEAKTLGIELVTGVEVSTCWANLDVHVVGLNVNIEHSALTLLLAEQEQRRVTRAVAMGDKLAKLGYPQIYSLAKKNASGHVPGRPHFAQALVSSGVCKNMNDTFKKFLSSGKKAYVKTQWPDFDEAVTAIKEAGGIAVLAHPTKYKLTVRKLRRLITAFKQAGGQAMEVSTGAQNPQTIQQMAELSVEFELCASTGSDYHGYPDGWVRLGKFPPLPRVCTPVWTLFNEISPVIPN